MGSVQSRNGGKLLPTLPSFLRYQKLSDSSDFLHQPLLDNEKVSMAVEHELKAHREKVLVLEKEIGELKSNVSRLQTKFESSISKLQSRPNPEAKATEGKTEDAITCLVQKVDKLMRSMDKLSLGHDVEKHIVTAQELAIKRIEEKSVNVETEFAEMKGRVDEITSTMLDMAAVIADMNSNSRILKEQPEVIQDSSFDIKMKISENELFGCIIFLVFLLSFLIGINL